MIEKKERWIRPWNVVKFDDLYNRDDRFFSVVMKGMINWLNHHIVMYDKPIPHFIYSTGSSYMYMESNGYEFSWNETSGEDQMYMQMPRCIIEIAGVNVPMEELTSPYAMGVYERRNGTSIQGFNANMRRIPIEIDINLKYVLANFNESIVLLEEIINSILFQRYYTVAFLGQALKCSIEFPANFNIELNRIDMTDTTTNQKNVQLQLKICTNYPSIDELTETPNSAIISAFSNGQTFIEWSKIHPVSLMIKDDEDNVSVIKVHLDANNELCDENGNNIEEQINLGNVLDELGNPISKQNILKAFKYEGGSYQMSTIFSNHLGNVVDPLKP